MNNEFFDIILEDYHNNLSFVHEKIIVFLMNIFIDNTNGILNQIQEFISNFVTLNDTNIFQIKVFFTEFLTSK